MSSSDRANKMLQGLKGKAEEEKTSKPKTSVSSTNTVTTKDPRGRKKRADSKRSRLASGELSKLSVLVPSELHIALNVMAAKDPNKDMSDIVTEILRKHVKTD